jgi:hypothetical protein
MIKSAGKQRKALILEAEIAMMRGNLIFWLIFFYQKQEIGISWMA